MSIRSNAEYLRALGGPGSGPHKSPFSEGDHVIVGENHWNKTNRGKFGIVKSTTVSQQNLPTHYVKFPSGGGEFVHAEDLAKK